MTLPNYTKHCIHCGSQSVLVPALVRWEPEHQYWVIEDMPEGADTCTDCGVNPTQIESREIYHNSKRRGEQ